MSKEAYSPQYVEGMTQLERDHDWKFQRSAEYEIAPELVAYHDEGTPGLLTSWREIGDPVEVSIVIVSPNRSLLTLPARTLGYAGAALALSRRAIVEWGVNISNFRVLSPVHVNEFCDGGNLFDKLRNTQKLQGLITDYKESYYPDLQEVEVTLDVGKPITPDVVDALRPKAEQILEEQPVLAAELAHVADKRARDSVLTRPLRSNLLPLIYLLAHPEAWGYGSDEILYAENGQKRINYMPASELRYLAHMSRIKNIWTKASDHQVATLLANGYETAPYYRSVASEPLMQDLAGPNLADMLRYYKNHYRNFEGRIGLEQIVADTSQSGVSLQEIMRKLDERR